MTRKLECIDVGSEYCPCYLAEANDCITCSILQGEELCECRWAGICVYQEYIMNGCKKRDKRENLDVSIEDIIDIGNDCHILKLKVDKELARQLREPGAYIFIRGSDSPNYFDTPMSIMDVDITYGYIYIAYQVLGAKTRQLRSNKETFSIRGPYWNGLYGMKKLKQVSNQNCLVIARGIAQAPAVLVIKKLIENQNNVTFILDRGNIEDIFIKECIKDLNVKIIEKNVRSSEGIELIEDILKRDNIKLVYSGGSDVLHSSVIKAIDRVGKDPYIVITNNNEICCGEGVCGGCTIRLADGTRAKTCKTQLDARKVIERRVIND